MPFPSPNRAPREASNRIPTSDMPAPAMRPGFRVILCNFIDNPRDEALPGRGVGMRFGKRTYRLAVCSATFVVCCAADGSSCCAEFLTSREVAPEHSGAGTSSGLAARSVLTLDNAVRAQMIPAFQMSPDGALGIPPGMIAVVPLATGTRYESRSDSSCAPYVVFGDEAPVATNRQTALPCPQGRRGSSARGRWRSRKGASLWSSGIRFVPGAKTPRAFAPCVTLACRPVPPRRSSWPRRDGRLEVRLAAVSSPSRMPSARNPRPYSPYWRAPIGSPWNAGRDGRRTAGWPGRCLPASQSR